MRILFAVAALLVLLNVPVRPFLRAWAWLRSRELFQPRERVFALEASAASDLRRQPDYHWYREVSPREVYRIRYDKNGDVSDRLIELVRIGTRDGEKFYGAMNEGRFKTFRASRVVAVEQLTENHPCSITPPPTYATVLPAFPVPRAFYRIPTIKRSNRTYGVDLNRYTCTCPEGRDRRAAGYAPGQLGYVCPHMARAIVQNLPPDHTWDPALIDFLSTPTKVSLANLV